MFKVEFFILILCSLFIGQAKAQELLNYPLDTVNGEEVYRYEVERSVGLWRIGKNFGVTQNEIIRLNPELESRGLHYGETLLIPTHRPVLQETEAVVVSQTVTETRVVPQPEAVPVEQPETIVPDTLVPDSTQTDSVQTALPDSLYGMTEDGRRIVELALLLPFESQQTQRSANAERMLEFYQGALLALQDLQNDSTLFRLRVIDTERNEKRIKELCDSTELDHVQAILGPVYPVQISRMTKWCAAHDVPMLLPFSDDIRLEQCTQVLQFNSTDQQEADSLCRWLGERDSLIHCIAVEVRDADLAASMRAMRKQLKANNIPCAALPLRDLMNDSAAYAMDSARENIIILHSDKYQHVRILLPHLVKLQEQGFMLRIISQYSWQKEEIALPQLYTSMFTAEADREAYDARWEETFTNAHVSEAPRYDLLGYDLMQALVARLQGEQEKYGLQSDIRWIQVGEGGYQNECVKVIAY